MRSIGLVLIAAGVFMIYLVATNKVTAAMSALFTGSVPQATPTVPSSIFTDPKQDASLGTGVKV